MGVTILSVWQYYGCYNIMDVTILWAWQYYGCDNIIGVTISCMWQYYGRDNIMGVTILWVWQYFGCDNIMGMTILRMRQYYRCDNVMGVTIPWVTIFRGLLSIKQRPSMIVMATSRYLRKSTRLPALDQDHHRWRGVRGFRLISSGLIQNTYSHIN